MAKRRLPAGFDDELAFLADVREQYRFDVEADKVNRDAAFDDLKFACDFRDGPGATHGAQWDNGVVEQRAGRPCLTNNVIPQYIGQIVGDNRINRPAIKVRPAEDADEELAEVRAGIIRYIEAQSNAQWIYTTTLQSSSTCGIGNFRCGLDYADNGSFLRDIRIKPIANPLAPVWDRNSVERTGRDAKRCNIPDEYNRKDFQKEWPDAIPGGFDPDLSQSLMADGWLTEDKARICEHWRLEEEKVEVGLTETGETVEIAKAPKIMAFKETRTVTRTKACMWLVTGFSILEGPFEVPTYRIPVFRCYGRLFFVGNSRAWFGLTRLMKDAQRLQNYADSVIAESLATAPKQQWQATAAAVEGREEIIRQAHRSGDPLLVFNDGGEVSRLDPPPMPMGFLQWRQLLTQQMKDISGLQDASLGIQSNETSGKAIMARQREGDVATIEYHDNLNAAIAECGRVINDLIPIVYDTPRQIRIVGEDEAMSVIRVNDPNDPEAKDMSQGKFDIVVETGPSYTTKRVEAAEQIIELTQAFPQIAGVAGDIIVSALDLPGGDKLASRMKLLLPPEAREDEKDPADMTPEEQQQFAQQKQEMQQQQQVQQEVAQKGIELEMAEKEATINKLVADAEKTRADAMKIMREAETPEQGEQANPLVAEAEARKAIAEARAAEANALTAEAKTREAEANANLAEARAYHSATDATFNELDAEHKLEHGRGITDPEPTANGAGDQA